MNAIKNIAISGSPFGYIIPINEKTGALSPALRFANLQSSSYKLLKQEDENSATENLDISRCDNGTIRFPKQTIVLSGIDGKKVGKDASGTGTKSGEITMQLNEADENATSWTEGVAKIASEVAGKLCLVAIGAGFTYSGLNASTKNVDGWVYMLGKTNNDLEVQLGNNASTLSLTFESHKPSVADTATIKAAISGANVFGPITYYIGEATEPTVTAPAISAGNADLLLAGKIVVVPTSAPRG